MNQTFNKILQKFILCGILIIIMNFNGCTKAPINGNLDGEWEVMDVVPSPPSWDHETRFFMSFYMHVCQLTIYGYPFTQGNMRYDDNTISLDFPFIKTPEEQLQLMQYGIYSNPVTFNVEFHGKYKMTLYNDESTITLRKF